MDYHQSANYIRDQIEMGKNSFYDGKINVKTNTIYLSEGIFKKHSLVSVDCNSKLVTRIPMEGGSGSLTINPETNLIYYGYYSGISIIDGATNTVVDSLPIKLDYGVSLAVNPKTNRLYIPSPTKNLVSVFDCTTKEKVKEIIWKKNVGGIWVDQFSNRIFASLCPYSISIIDGNSDSVIDELTWYSKKHWFSSTLFDRIENLFLNSNKNILYLLASKRIGFEGACSFLYFLVVVNLNTREIIYQPKIPIGPREIAINEIENMVYLMEGAGKILKLNETGEHILERVDYNVRGFWNRNFYTQNSLMIFNPVKNKLYVYEPTLNSLLVLDP